MTFTVLLKKLLVVFNRFRKSSYLQTQYLTFCKFKVRKWFFSVSLGYLYFWKNFSNKYLPMCSFRIPGPFVERNSCKSQKATCNSETIYKDNCAKIFNHWFVIRVMYKNLTFFNFSITYFFVNLSIDVVQLLTKFDLFVKW